MKIAIIRKKYTPYGGETYLRALINELKKIGWDIHIYCRKWNSDSAGDVKVNKVFAFPFPSFLREISFSLTSYLMLKGRKDFALIQSHEKTFLQDILRCGDGVHKEWLRQRLKRVNLLKKLLIFFNPFHLWLLFAESFIYKTRRFKKIIAISEMVKKNLIEHYGVDSKDIVVIYNGIDIERFNKNSEGRNEIRRIYQISESDFVVLFVGSGFERKGVRYFIETLEKVKYPAVGLIVGKGNSKKYEKLIKKQRIIFCGPQKNIEKYYAASDAFLFPTIYEPFGLAILEAMASGLPVITTKLAGAAEIITHSKDGFVVDKPEDIDKMKSYIEVLIEDAKLRKTISENAQMKASFYSINRNVKEVLKLYEQVLNSR